MKKKGFWGIILCVLFLFVMYLENQSSPFNTLEYAFEESVPEVTNTIQDTSAPLRDDYQSLTILEEENVDLQIVGSMKESSNGLEIGSKAPIFSLESLEGEVVTLDQLKGKKVLINFWATWCPPCKEELPDMQELYNENQNKLEILAINLDPENNVHKFRDEYELRFPILLDKENHVNELYKVLAVPTSYVIDENGIIINKHIGALDEDAFQKLIDG